MMEKQNVYQRSMINKILDYKFSMFFIILIIMLSAYIYTTVAKKKYTTDATIEIIPKTNQLSSEIKIQLNEGNFFRNLKNQISYLKSRSFLQKVIQKSQANIVYFQKSDLKYNKINNNLPFKISNINIKDDSFYGKMFMIKDIGDNSYKLVLVSNKLLTFQNFKNYIQYQFSKELKTKYFDILIEKNKYYKNIESGQELFFKIYDKEKYSDWVESNLDIFQVDEKSSMIKVTYSDENPYSAKYFLDTLLKEYLSIKKQNQLLEANDFLKSINTKLTSQKMKLNNIEKKLKDYIQNNKVAGLSGQTNQVVGIIYKYELNLQKLELKLQKIKSISRIFHKSHQFRDILTLSSDINNQGLVQLINSIDFDIKTYKKLRMKYTKKYPDVQKIINTILQKIKKLDKNINELKMNTISQIKDIKGYISEYKQKLNTMPQKEFGYSQLKRQYDLLEKHYLYLLEKKTQLTVSQNTQGKYEYQVIDKPYLPEIPSQPKKKVLLLLAFVFSLIVSVFYALLRDYFSKNIKSIDELKEITLLPIMGTIPYIKNKKYYNNLFVVKEPNSYASEMIWNLRTNIEDFIPLEKGKKSLIVAITSSIKGEGKTTIASNLALTLGMGDKKTVVISFDMRLPELHTRFSVPNDVGISSVLFKNKTLDEVSFKTKDFPNFTIIPVGEDFENPLKIINSTKIDNILEQLRQKYDYIVLDLPPFMVASESLFLMKKVDLVLCVLKVNYSQKSFIIHIEDLISKHKIKSIGLVLNAVNEKNLQMIMRKENKKYIKMNEKKLKKPISKRVDFS